MQLREMLDRVERLGAIALETDPDKERPRVLVFGLQGTHEKAERLLSSYTRYLCASLARRAGERLTFEEARKLLGFVGCPHEPGPILQRRDALMERAGWPTATLTLDEL